MRIWLPAIRVGTGVDIFTIRLAEALAARGCDPLITWFPPAYEFLPELMRAHRIPDGVKVVHANSMHAHVFCGRELPVVATVHHLVHDPAYAPYRTWKQAAYHRWHIRWREAKAIAGADAVTAVSPYVAKTVRSLFCRTDVDVITNWVDLTQYVPLSSERPSGGGPFRLLWVGNPSRRKGADLLHQVARRLGDGFQIRCVGGLRGDAGVAASSGVVWLGRLSEDELISEYQRCDALLSLARYEGFGYAALEAMSCGRPVVGFSAGGLVDVVRHEVSGFLSAIDDLDQLVDRIRQLAADSDLRWRMGAAGRAIASAAPQSVDRYIQVYERVVDAGGQVTSCSRA